MNPASDFQTIATHVGMADRSNRVRIEVTGPDRAKLLHNLTTNDVQRLPVGRGCEAFVTSTQGKTLAYTILLACDDRILVRSDPGGMDLALPHFRQYGVFSDVTIEDVTASTFEFHLVGTDLAKLVRSGSSELPGEGDYAHKVTEFYGFSLRAIRESPTGLPGVTVIGAASDAEPVWNNLVTRGREFGLIVVDSETFEVLRIAGGTPVFGKDVTEKNLPQEIGRDERAISFVKGCYLGQETVARLDALGHVNQILKGLRFAPGSPCPPAGSVLLHEGKPAGVVTSAVFSPVRAAPLALAFVRTNCARAGTKLDVQVPGAAAPTTATVSDLSLLTQV
ncbi:MAG: YgfZ/GcvT domain-containing protein [Isosphaeraceae bacterium]